MKIIFVNAPHIRSKNSSSENDFKIDGFVFHLKYRSIKGAKKLFRFFHEKFGLGGTVRYGLRAGSRWPWTQDTPSSCIPYPFFMGYSAAYLKSNGFEVNILDAVAEEEYDYEKFLEEVKAEKADIVVIECSTPTIDIDVWFAQKVTAFAEVALAGPHLNPETAAEIQNKNTGIKYFLLGEYILSSLKMAQTRTPGIYPSTVLKDVDSIPFPFRDYKSAHKYYEPTMETARPQLQVYGSKGCAFKCTFCSWPQTMYFAKVSLRKPELIAQEIKEAVAKHGYKSILFDDDTFNMGPDRISRLCEHLKEIGLPWTMMGRLDCSPDWLYDKMVDSGCVGMRFGIETFDLGVLARVQKGIERVDFRSTLEHLSKKYPQVMIHLTMMKDMPGQTEEIHQNDMKILADMGYSRGNIYRSYQLSRCVPFPGTKLYEEMKQSKGEETLKDYKAYDGSQETVMKKLNV
jgi:radical SAM superfamily enzyme YgiQ (UPF0313 family)